MFLSAMSFLNSTGLADGRVKITLDLSLIAEPTQKSDVQDCVIHVFL